MKNFLVLTIILMLGAYGRVVAQDAAAASKRANQQYGQLREFHESCRSTG